MSDTWEDLQAIKSRQSSLREKMRQRKREREGIVAQLAAVIPETAASLGNVKSDSSAKSSTSAPSSSTEAPSTKPESLKIEPDVEKKLLLVLCDIMLDIPSDALVITKQTSKLLGREVKQQLIEQLLHKFEAQQMLSIFVKESGNTKTLTVTSVDLSKLAAVGDDQDSKSRKRKRDSSEEENFPSAKQQKQDKSVAKVDDSIESLLSMQSAKEKEEKKMNEEILQLLSKPTAKEQYLVDKFRSRGGAQLKEFCQYGTRDECLKYVEKDGACKKLHFRKIIRKHTDESLGDCSFLNTCFHMDTCKYVHYEIDFPTAKKEMALLKKENTLTSVGMASDCCLYPPQWIQCDLRIFNMSVLGKCAVVMADPPWDIHMELPYGTMSDDEMRRLDVPGLQDDGFIFLWVTGRAMELGRECLDLWGYKRCDELIWVKTNQLQRIIRTGRTGHWLNHGKEHCLVGVKGNPEGVNRGLDCDVIVAEVRATSHKPDEIYGIIERLSPGTRKCELFGRPHNVQPNWITLGNQVEGVRLKDPDVVKNFRAHYPDGNCMGPPKDQ
ncbi:N6-adenosine-methyltransferase subunit METTL3-like [Gigantopelta aegis]|uniref:N6-adenosine-methyltransferase subunit METTL3-like n=1 Tax=Gigantopelta aegis TaxID=1735272 RepID=UPI001B88C54C|nr:N6-adenosine-methyltransferase subunit METTL3-like [Gigantopelta aegis]